MYSFPGSTLLVLAVALSCPLGFWQADQTTLLSDEIKVSAFLTDVTIDRSCYAFEIAVSRGNDNYSFSSVIVAARTEEEAISIMKEGVGWKAGYFFVRTECGG
jgi:hypothetical protein